MAFIKNSDVVHGLGDLQWHQDDGLGGHPVMCPLIQVGVQLDVANAVNGQLWVLAGSHRYSKHPLAWGDEDDQPVVRFETEPGDVTIHYGDIFHTTPAPTGAQAGRRVLYYKFAEPKTFDAIPAGAHYNDVLFKAGAGGRVATRADTWSEEDSQEAFEEARFADVDDR
jgi:ectoine hydroxylase-related dioxygenase (phytanoyl-CoA dioxygenase family)